MIRLVENLFLKNEKNRKKAKRKSKYKTLGKCKNIVQAGRGRYLSLTEMDLIGKIR